MKKIHWIIVFLVILAAHLAAIALDNALLVYITKPMLLACLIAFFVATMQSSMPGLNKWIITALAFSWLGDVLLMFQPRSENFFLAGLCAFLLAHIFYIIYFHRVRLMEQIRSNAWFLLLIVVYYAGLISFLSPYLGDMKLAVRIYGLVISFMFLLALHMVYLKEKASGIWMLLGAVFFVVSDSLLALNKFYRPFPGAGILIMLTYGLAQLFLVLGALRYSLRKTNSAG